MKQKVYLETTIASYLTARPNRDLVMAAHQELTLEWWADHRQRFDTFVSDFVLSESAKGDKPAAARRLAELRQLLAQTFVLPAQPCFTFNRPAVASGTPR